MSRYVKDAKFTLLIVEGATTKYERGYVRRSKRFQGKRDKDVLDTNGRDMAEKQNRRGCLRRNTKSSGPLRRHVRSNDTIW
jgi:hypothetical protein